MTWIQLLAIAAAAVMLYITYTGLRRNELSGREFALWTAIWGGLVVVSLFADRLRAVVAPLQVARLLDLVMIAGLVALGAMLLGLNRDLRRVEGRLAELVRALALARSAGEEARRQEGDTVGDSGGTAEHPGRQA